MNRVKTRGWWGGWRSRWRASHVFLAPGPSEAGTADRGALVPGHDQALLAWRDWCADHAGQRCQVALSCQWVMSGMVRDQDATTVQDAQAFMARQWDHYVNLSADQLAAHWLVRTTRVDGAWLVCAVPLALVQDLTAIAHTHGVVVTRMAPWWADGAQRWVSCMAQAGLSDSSRQLTATEPGWAITLEVDAGRLCGMWAEPVSTRASVRASRATTVSLAGPAPAIATCLRDDDATRALVSGRDPSWLEVA